MHAKKSSGVFKFHTLDYTLSTPYYGKILKKYFTKEGVFMYFNTQEDIITKLAKSLEKSLILRKKFVKILVRIMLDKSTIVSKRYK